MLNLFWIGFSSFLAALSGAIVPGPVFTLVLTESLKSGKITGPLIVLGHLLIEGAIILLVFIGLQPVLQSREVMMIAGYIGGAALMLIGLKLILDSLRVKIKDSLNVEGIAGRGKTPIYKLVFLGFLASCSNPYFFLWWLATGLPIMVSSISIAGVSGFLSFLIGHAAADLSWFSFVSYSVHESRKIMGERTLQIILLCSSVFLISFAAYIVFSAAFLGR
ncbi:MAG: LysE family transporter [Candidatus Bathyarchaeia archaeon]|nr:LysE family transporter [Candidatus Bathyarchaeota archaeon]